MASPVGASRLGGLPDAWPHFNWPRVRHGLPSSSQLHPDVLDEPLVFLGQLNWGQLKPYDFEGVLPSTGGSLFFTGIGAGAGTYFVTSIPEFPTRHFPLPPDLRYVLPQRALIPRFEWTLPYYGLHGTIGGGDFQMCFFDTFEPELEFLELSAAERKAYDGFRAHIQLPGPHRHRVLGHPNYEQNPVQLDLERQEHGLLDYENYLALCDSQNSLTRQLKSWAVQSRWRLAFQVGHFVSDDGLWTDAGTHYFWSKQEDLRSGASRFVGDGQCD